MKVRFKFDKEEHIYHIDDKELQEIKEDYKINNNEFKKYIKPLSTKIYDIDTYKNHYLYGWWESYCQSDSIPHNWWETNDNNGLLEFVR